jgi:NADH:ubiquinone oxidoreductase subunit F (NADH-binding)
VNTVETRYREADGEPCLQAGRLPRLLPRLPGGSPANWAEHRARYGELPVPGWGKGWRDQFIAEVGRSGLTGRGGASFPTARKLRAVAAGRDAPVVIANGTEGEPASAKDKVLLAREPHLVLDGVVLAAYLVGARQAFVVVHEAVREIVDRAAAERSPARRGGIRLKVVTGVDRFVGGEASALVNWVGNGIPLPTATPPRVFEDGLYGRPTLVQNVETLAHLALIGRYGAQWFRSLGTAAEPGSMLVTLIGGVHRPGVYEIEIGQPVGEILDLAGGPAAPLGALLIGGYFGTWADPEIACPLPFSAAGLSQVGAGPGAGLIAALPARSCGLAETARVVRYLAGESAGQCGPCVFGLDALAGALEDVAAGRSFRPDLLRRWMGQVDGRGACHFPDGAVRLIRSALRVFGDEIDRHADGWCRGSQAPGVLPVPARSAP